MTWIFGDEFALCFFFLKKKIRKEMSTEDVFGFVGFFFFINYNVDFAFFILGCFF
jgi:hypothetical protein